MVGRHEDAILVDIGYTENFLKTLRSNDLLMKDLGRAEIARESKMFSIGNVLAGE
jgi:hypothetical protein